jgi:hypothetical protein
MQVARLQKDHFDKKSRMEQLLEYYDCPSCMTIRDDMLECPKCHSRGCQVCMELFSKNELSKYPNYKQTRTYKCLICLKVGPQLPPHRFLVALLADLNFQCPNCVNKFRHAEYLTHVKNGKCHKNSM